MAIQVVGVKIRHNGQVYGPGEVIDKIEKQEAKRLVDEGFASFLDKPKASKGKEEE